MNGTTAFKMVSVEERKRMAEDQRIQELRMVEIDQNDPRLIVEIAEIPHRRPEVKPIVLAYKSQYKDNIDRYPPEIDDKGVSHYRVPREYAERLLPDRGGRKYRLIAPEEVLMTVENNAYGTEIKRVVANAIRTDKNGRVFFEELTDREIKKRKEERLSSEANIEKNKLDGATT